MISEERARIKALEREIRELRQANEMLRKGCLYQPISDAILCVLGLIFWVWGVYMVVLGCFFENMALFGRTSPVMWHIFAAPA